jgi:hypothetical protein
MAALLLLLQSVFPWPPHALAGSSLYWCPDRTPDQQLGATAEPGCVPLVEEKERQAIEPRPLNPETFVSDVARFLEHYRWFLDCCATDLGSIEGLEDLEQQATDLLSAIHAGLFSELIKLRGFTLRKLVPPVARARDDLRNIKQRLTQFQEVQGQLETLDYLSAWRERRRIREQLEAVAKAARPATLPAGPPTGMQIGVTPLMGPEIGIVPATGPEVGTAPPTGSDIGVTPPTGREIGRTPPTGSEIGTTGRVGPDIGESSLNRPTQ